MGVLSVLFGKACSKGAQLMTPLRYTRQELADALQAYVWQTPHGQIGISAEYPRFLTAKDGEKIPLEDEEGGWIPIRSWWYEIEVADDWRESLTSPRTDTRIEPPKAPYEVTLQVGAETFELLCSRVYDEALRWESQGFVRKGMWGGAGTHGHVEVEQREVTPEQYRRELQDWHTSYKEARRDKAEPEVCEWKRITEFTYQRACDRALIDPTMSFDLGFDNETKSCRWCGYPVRVVEGDND